MKRIRGNGGARSRLREEGIIILGQYEAHREIARQLELDEIPGKGESVSARVSPGNSNEPGTAMIDGAWWRVANKEEPEVLAPVT